MKPPTGKSTPPADLEEEMLKRGMPFEVIDRDKGQAKLPFEE
jgi:polynucleotide 5'-kinase involved in rRNA processing